MNCKCEICGNETPSLTFTGVGGGRCEKCHAAFLRGEERNCHNCLNRAMDMDMDPYCAVANKPWGLVLSRGKPKECGPESKLWQKDVRGN